MQTLSDQPAPPTPSRFLSLPPELLTTVVRMARDQDDALAERLLISRETIVEATELITTEKRWYGRSLRALYATSKQLNRLCRPMVWHTVKLSHACKPFFSDSLLLLYGTFIRHLIFDPCTKPVAVESLLISTLSMPLLNRLSFDCASAGRRLRELEENHSRNNADTATICLRPALAALKPRIRRLAFAEHLKSADVIAGLQLWPNITHLSRNLRYADDAHAEALEITDLKSLVHLEIGTHWSFGQMNVEGALRTPDNTIDWPTSWQEEVWPATLRSFSFACSTLSDDEWEFIGTLGATLEELHLELLGTSTPAGLRPLGADYNFPHLASLSVVGGSKTVREVLHLFAETPLRAINLEVINLNYEDLDALFGSEGAGRLETFQETLETLEISRYGYPLDGITPYSSARIHQFGVKRFGTSSSKGIVFNTPSFTDIEEDFMGSEWDSEVSSPWAVSSHTALLSTHDLLNRIRGTLVGILKGNDQARIETLNLALRPLAALDLLDRD